MSSSRGISLADRRGHSGGDRDRREEALTEKKGWPLIDNTFEANAIIQTLRRTRRGIE
jgi:hypothetical protein